MEEYSLQVYQVFQYVLCISMFLDAPSWSPEDDEKRLLLLLQTDLSNSDLLDDN